MKPIEIKLSETVGGDRDRLNDLIKKMNTLILIYESLGQESSNEASDDILKTIPEIVWYCVYDRSAQKATEVPPVRTIAEGKKILLEGIDKVLKKFEENVPLNENNTKIIRQADQVRDHVLSELSTAHTQNGRLQQAFKEALAATRGQEGDNKENEPPSFSK